MILTIAALLPAVYLIGYVYKKDRVEKEPAGLLWKLALMGAVATIPAAVFEIVLENFLGIFFFPDQLLYQLISNFLIVAVVEEFWKRQAVMQAAWKHPAFNYRFDAIVYAVCSAMGFAALENIMYVADGGLSVAVSRALLAVPSHAVDGVLMGFFLGEAKLCERQGDFLGRKKNLRSSLLVPVLAHGFYDFCLTRGTVSSMLCFVVFVVIMDVFAVRKINQASKEDVPVDGMDRMYW